MTFLGITGLLNFLTSAALGLFVFNKCPRRDVGAAYGLMNGGIAFWSLFYFIWQCQDTADSAILPFKLLTLGAIWLNQALVWFVLVFLGRQERARKIMMFVTVLNLVFTTFLFSNHFYAGLFLWPGMGYWPAPPLGNGFLIYLIFWHAELLFALVQLLAGFRSCREEMREQLKYITTAIVIGYIGGITNWPPFFGIRIPPYLNGLVMVYSSIIAYAVVKHRLMQITIIVRRTLIYSVITAALAILYMVLIVLSAHLFERVVGHTQLWGALLVATITTVVYLPLRQRVQHFMDKYFFREALNQALLREATSGFVHEIKRPLAKISLPAELSLMDLQDLSEGRRTIQEVLPKVQQRLRYILDQTADAGDRIEAIRGVSSSDAGPTEALDLAEIIRTSVAAKAELLGRHGVEIKLDLDHDLPDIRGHAKQLEIVVTNLIKNAVEAMAGNEQQSARTIRITAARSDAQLTMRVADTGPGIKPENLPHLFEPYFTTKGLHGMGMGLFLCRQIVLAHGGTLDARSEPGRGAEFIVRLPVMS